MRATSGSLPLPVAGFASVKGTPSIRTWPLPSLPRPTVPAIARHSLVRLQGVKKTLRVDDHGQSPHIKVLASGTQEVLEVVQWEEVADDDLDFDDEMPKKLKGWRHKKQTKHKNKRNRWSDFEEEYELDDDEAGGIEDPWKKYAEYITLFEEQEENGDGTGSEDDDEMEDAMLDDIQDEAQDEAEDDLEDDLEEAEDEEVKDFAAKLPDAVSKDELVGIIEQVDGLLELAVVVKKYQGCMDAGHVLFARSAFDLHSCELEWRDGAQKAALGMFRILFSRQQMQRMGLNSTLQVVTGGLPLGDFLESQDFEQLHCCLLDKLPESNLKQLVDVLDNVCATSFDAYWSGMQDQLNSAVGTASQTVGALFLGDMASMHAGFVAQRCGLPHASRSMSTSVDVQSDVSAEVQSTVIFMTRVAEMVCARFAGGLYKGESIETWERLLKVFERYGVYADGLYRVACQALCNHPFYSGKGALIMVCSMARVRYYDKQMYEHAGSVMVDWLSDLRRLQKHEHGLKYCARMLCAFASMNHESSFQNELISCMAGALPIMQNNHRDALVNALWSLATSDKLRVQCDFVADVCKRLQRLTQVKSLSLPQRTLLPQLNKVVHDVTGLTVIFSSVVLETVEEGIVMLQILEDEVLQYDDTPVVPALAIAACNEMCHVLLCFEGSEYDVASVAVGSMAYDSMLAWSVSHVASSQQSCDDWMSSIGICACITTTAGEQIAILFWPGSVRACNNPAHTTRKHVVYARYVELRMQQLGYSRVVMISLDELAQMQAYGNDLQAHLGYLAGLLGVAIKESTG